MGAWAFEAWQRASNGALKMLPAADERKARVRIYWASGRMHLYGETRPLDVDGRRGAAIYVLPELAGLGGEIAEAGVKDKLFRDSIVYLTCLHESGHALGLPHTADFADIMYTFQFGGDIVEYFARYRRALKRRTDIASTSGISTHDRLALMTAAK
ncbi:MAG: matrixin family metalloprotease [Bryobacteraceae bacterium]